MDKDTSYFNDEKKITYFHDSAVNSAKEQAQVIYNEISGYREKYFEAEDKKLAQEISSYEAAKLSDAQKALKKDLSEFQMNKKFEVLSLKKQLKEKIFSDVEAKVKAFCKSGAYLEFLYGLIDKCLEISSESFELEICPSDEHFSEELKSHVLLKTQNASFSVTVNSGIAFGGIRFYDKVSKIIINETLDERLAVQFEKFSL